MTAEDVRAAVDAAIGARILLTYPQLILFVLLSGVAAYLGAYLRRKGENLATREDLQQLTKEVEDIKILYSKEIEDYKAELVRRTRIADVAEFLTHWIDPNADRVKLNGYAMTLSLWLPHELYQKLAACICHKPGAPTPKQILIEIRKHLLKDQAGEMVASEIIHFDIPRPSVPSSASQ